MIVYENANWDLATERRRQPGKVATPLRVLVGQAHLWVSSVDVPCGPLGSDKTTRGCARDSRGIRAADEREAKPEVAEGERSNR
jgi:hypothetical protein